MAGYTVGAGTTLSTGYTITTADGNGFALTNNGVIGAPATVYAVLVQTTGDVVTNSGKILADTVVGKGVFSDSSIRVTNKSGGTIKAGYGINLYGGGSINNASGALVTGVDPIRAFNDSVSVNNYGVIIGTGSSSTRAGVLLNAGGYVYNHPNASISGANGVSEGVFAKVRNEGTITGNDGAGVYLRAGGTVTTETQTPNSAATISGSYAGISIAGGVGYVLDVSGISGGVAGVFLQDGGYLHQIGGPAGKPGGGTITAYYAVAINNGSGTVDTGGAILGTKLGVGMDGAGPHKVTLSGIGATISGAKAISIAGGSGYISDKGTINGGTSGVAIVMAGGYNNLIEIYAGAKIIGNVNGGNFQGGPHTTTLLLAQSGGTLTGFGNRYYNIGNVTVNAGASWTMDSTDIFVDPSFVSSGATTFVPGTLVDAGTLTFGGSEYARLTLAGNAHLTVSKGGVLTPAYASVAIYAPSGASSAVVVTDGHVTAGGNDGIRLDDGGTVTNQSDGVISAQFVGVRIQNAKGTVTNSGLIKSTITYGIALGAGGTVTNTGGTIMGTLGVGIYGGAGMVTNTGRIAGSGSDDGVALKAGGTVFNQAGTITGLGGVFITGGAGTVTNYGQITGTGIYSVNLSPGFANRLRIGPGASFSGNFVNGGNTAGATSVSTIELLSAAGVGTINGIGSQYKYFSDITVDSGAAWTIGSSGSIAAYQTLVDSGTVINEVLVASDVTLANGTFINASGYLSGDDGVIGLSGTNVVVNNSNIRATGIGVSFATAGRVTNQSDGFIGGRLGVYIGQEAGASVVNQGLIEGYLAVYLPKGGSVDNQGGVISGRVGVVISGGNGTVRNAGMIVSVGDYGVILPDHGADRLVLVPGSTIAGLVHGGLAGTGTSFSSLELASGNSAGTIGGIGSQYFNFVDFTVDSGAAWTFAAGQTIAANQALVDNGTLTNNARVLTDIQLGSGAVLTNASDGTVSTAEPVLGLPGLASAATVMNYGLLDGGTGGYGVELLSGGSVTNRAGTIKSRTGVAIRETGTVTNTGAIVGSGGAAVSLLQGFRNQVAMSPGAVFTGTVDGGNTSASGTAISTLELMTGTSAGTLSGIGSQYVHFQNFVVDPGASWTLAGGQLIPATYTLTDNGTLTSNATVLTGVTLGAGASLLNQTGAMISSASDGAIALGADVTLTNRDDIHGDSVGVSLIGPSAVVLNDNAASIAGGVFGVSISGGAGTVTNYGEIAGGLIGVGLTGGGTVVNYGDIAGIVFGGVGITGGAGTVVNDGTIAGGSGTVTALAAGFQNLVKLAPDAVFSGTVNGGNTIGAPQVSTLELTRGYIAGLGNYPGTVSGLGSRYINFGQITVDPGASWLVTGNPTLATGITLTNSGVLTISDGALSVAGNVNNFGVIQETAGTVTAGNLGGIGQVVIGAGSTLTASGSVGYGQTVAFAGAGLLALVPTQFSGQIDGLGGGGRIELTGIDDATSASVVNRNTLAILRSAGPTIDLTLDPTQNYTGAVFPVITLDGDQFVEEASPTGPTVIDQGETESVTGAAGSTLAAITGASGGIAVTGAKSLLTTTTGPFLVGGGGLGGLSIEAGGSVTTLLGSAPGPVAAVVANQSGSDGSSVNVTGAGSDWQVGGALVVGNAATGLLAITNGATVSATAVDVGDRTSGAGIVTVSGPDADLTTTGTVSVGDAGSGELSILDGANASIGGDLNVANAGSGTGNVDIEDTTGTITFGGNILVGFNGFGVFNVGFNVDYIQNNGGIIFGPDSSGAINSFADPSPFLSNSSPSPISIGAQGVDQLAAYLFNSGEFTIPTNHSLTFDTPIISGGGSFVLGSGDNMVLNADTVTGQTFTLGSDDKLTIGIDQLATIDLPASGTGPFTPETNPNKGDLLLGNFGGVIANFSSGDTIDVDTYLSSAAAGTLSQNGSLVSVIEIANGDTLGVLRFDTAANATAAIADDAITLVPCFAAGTRIATALGEVAVETIGVGERVRVLLGGGFSEVIWVGRREVDCAGHPTPRKVWPVRVAAGAFGPGRPHADVWLSPDHAVFVGEVLIPIKHLINGSTITQVTVSRVTYHHIELSEHNVLLAEGLPSESFLDMRDGSKYANRPGPTRLYPDYSARVWDAFGCTRLVITGPELDATRALVASFAAEREAALAEMADSNNLAQSARFARRVAASQHHRAGNKHARAA